MSATYTVFPNCRLCRDGRLVSGRLAVCHETGLIVDRIEDDAHATVNPIRGILAPGLIELQTNGMRGFHFTHFQDEDSYATNIDRVATYLPSTGVTSFFATLPTVADTEFQKILPFLKPRAIMGGATLLGAHAEGPFLHPSKKGAHNASLFHLPLSTSAVQAYGPVARSSDVLKLVTLAPELDGSNQLITDLVAKGVRVSLGHSAATFDEGLSAITAGASCLTHTLNAMPPMHHREPGLAGLANAAPAPDSPYFSIITDGNHLHPSIASMLFRSNPAKCIVITDSIELAGLDDGTYPGHSQIPHNQTKQGTRVVIEGTDTLIGGCASLQQCVQNVVRWSGCNIAEAVRCATENVADLMGEVTRGRLEPGRRADLVIFDDEANVLQTWVGGERVWERG